MSQYPVKLSRDSIAEATFELRFSSSQELASELLLGNLFSRVQSDFPKLQSLPIANIPKEIVAKEKNLWYQPKHKLEGKNYILALGDRSFTLVAKRPYQGWKDFKPTILRLLETLRTTAVVESIERFSLKYVNVIAKPPKGGSFDAFNIQAKLARFDLTQLTTFLRTEVPLNGFINVVQLIANADVTLGDGVEHLNGTLFDVDTISTQSLADFWKNSEQLLDAAHDTEKEVFFSILTQDAIKSMGPIKGL